MNVHPGDLAIVVGCPDSPFNGATCEVIGRPAHGIPRDLSFESVYWWVRFGRDMPWMAWTGDMTLRGREGAFPDQFLRKIGGHEQHTRDLELKWKRALSDEEMALMTSNPWQIFEPPAQ